MWKNGLIFFCLLPFPTPPPLPSSLRPSLSLSLSLPYLLWPNSARQSGLCSGLMWNLRNICSFLFQENDLRDWMCLFLLLLLAVKLRSCPVWFLDDGKEASKCFLSEFHVINLKAWFLSLPPPPPRAHDTMSSILSEVARSAHCSHYNQFIAAGTHTHENGRCVCPSQKLF